MEGLPPQIGCLFFFITLLLILYQQYCFYSSFRVQFSRERAIASINGKPGSFN